jgi:hypothetical protein
MRQSLFRLFDILSDLYRQSLSPITSLNRSLAAAHQSHIAARRALAIAIAEPEVLTKELLCHSI